MDVSEFNLEAWIREMETGEPFHLPPEKPEEDQFPYASPLEDLRKPKSARCFLVLFEPSVFSFGRRGEFPQCGSRYCLDCGRAPQRDSAVCV